MRIITLFFSLLLLTPIVHAATPRILVLGDSISASYGINENEGWVELLKKKIQTENPNSQVFNDSISGSTTSNGLERLPQALAKYHPTVVILELGGNDGLRGIQIKTIYQNLSEIIELSVKNNAKVLLLGITIPPNYGQAYRSQFENIFKDLAKKYQLANVPQILEGIADNNQLMQADGIHPNQQAQQKILDKVWPLLKE